LIFGEENDGIGKIITGKKPAENSDGLLIAWRCLTIDNDDRVKLRRMVLNRVENYLIPDVNETLSMGEKDGGRNGFLHGKINMICNYITKSNPFPALY
jgi:hypothetical protein